MNYVIGLDIGTSSVKGVLTTEDGTVVRTAKGSFSYIQTNDGIVELLPKSYLQVCYQTIRQLACCVGDGVIQGVCASSASGNLLLLDANCVPMCNIIGWQDVRVTCESTEILGSLNSDDFYCQVGWPFGGRKFPLAQLCYIKKHTPDSLKNCSMVCMSTEYLYYTLTGKWGISTSAGTPSFLLNQVTGEYIPSVLHPLGLTTEKLPPIMPCGAIVGYVKPDAALLCGLPQNTPIILGSFDHPSAARGVGVTEEGQMLLSCGTSWVAFFPIRDRKKAVAAKMLIDPFLSPNGCWGAMTSISSLSERLKLYVHRYIDHSEQAFQIMSKLAQQSVSGANGLKINLLKTPDDDAIEGFSKQDIARAIMESAVGLLKERLDSLAPMGISATEAVMVGGPSEDPYWVTLIQQICNITVETKHQSFAGAVGAAQIAQKTIGGNKDAEI